ncbi:[LysW]-lysine/[LysW]-ornithine hydrolase [uncultured archaeon]|nr:[LysW]-lysine/[LysW]-ornithine hydrolase [uncultured archaeon]
MDSVDVLKKLISINSVFGNELEMAVYLDERLRQVGFSTDRVTLSDARYNVVGERGRRGKPILFFGHMDTVPPYGKWVGSPFVPREDGDRIYGLGSADMKGGLGAILEACGQESDRKIKVAFCVDEENVSAGSQELVKSGFLRKVAAVVSTELSTSKGEPKGTGEITLGRRGRCVLEISVPGRSAHGAQGEKGISAIMEAARLVQELERLNGNLGSHRLLPPPTQFVRRLSAESTSLSIPERAVIELDRHLVSPQTPESALRETGLFIERLYAAKKFAPIDGKKITLRLKERATPYLAPYITPASNSYVRLLSKIAEEKAGSVSYGYGTSVADDNRLASAGLPVMSIAPLGAGEHTDKEWVSKSDYLRLIEILKEFIRRC